MTSQQLDTFIAEHSDAIAAIQQELATNFDTPAQRVINQGMARMGVARFDSTGDVWEQITCHINGWEYERPPENLMRRWASY